MIVIVDILVMIARLFGDKMLTFEVDESGEQCRLGQRLGVVLGLCGGESEGDDGGLEEREAKRRAR